MRNKHYSGNYYRVTLRHVLGAGVGIVTIGLLIGYGYLRTRDLIEGPVVEIYAPADGATIAGESIVVEGIARHVAFLYLNGSKIFTNAEGVFRESLPLPRGYSILEVTGRDKFERTATQTRRVVSIP